MMNTIERQIKNLEDENKARKASYQVAGGKVEFIMQTSQTFHKVGSDNNPVPARIKFIPDKPNANGISLITLSSQVAYNDNFTFPTEDATSYNEPQSGDGSVIINILAARIPYIATDYYFRVIATGPSTGVFTML
jgi:hypothetical protein